MATMQSSRLCTLPSPKDENPPVDLSSFHLLHDVFRIRAADPVQVPLLAFPSWSRGAADFEYFTGKDLDRFTDEAAWYYAKATMDTASSRTIAILGPTNLDWVVSTIGLSRAGYTVLTLSPRLSYQAMVKLMQETKCDCLVFYPSAQLRPVVDQVQGATVVRTISMMTRSEYCVVGGGSPIFVREVDVMKEKKRFAAIVHSSGSTGLPKPIYCTHTRFTTPYAIGPGDRELFTVPLYHIFAFQLSFAHMYQRKTVYFLNPHLPLTCETVTIAIREAKPGTLCAVPYVLKLLREQQGGVDALKSCGQVVFTGSQCPDDLGDYLVERGVNLASFMGATECGFTGASLGLPPEDKAWNYIRVPPPLMRHILPKPINKDTFEFIYLKEFPTLTVSNSDDPPGSFHSRDIYTPHKSISGAWKYLGRLDDRVNLINGEKVLPLPIEGRIRKAALVKEAVVFGVGKSVPGLLLFRAENARNLSDEAFVLSVWPEIEKSNRLAESFSQIGKDMVVPLPFGVEIPVTDKGSIIRAQLYKTFEREIDNAYASLEDRFEGTMKLDKVDLDEYLMKLAQQVIGLQACDLHDDLFALGMNSLQAIHIRGCIARDLDLGGNGKKLGQNVVFEHSSLGNLSKYLYNLRLNIDPAREQPIGIMRGLISKFSVFNQPRPCAVDAPSKHVIILTGATGGLGAHILSHLLEQSNVETVCCLLRGSDPSSRLQKSLKDRHLIINDNQMKLTVLTSNLSSPKLGLTDSTYTEILSKATHIIHCAWPVNFQLALSAFEPSIQGLQNLLQLSLDVSFSTPARFLFCSSISTALRNPVTTPIPEAPIENLEQASLTGYAQSKLVGERIVQVAVEEAGANAKILRIGQVVGDTKFGLWNDNEAFPLIIRSALTMGILPDLELACEWLPVDTLAEAIVQIGGLATDSEPPMKRVPSSIASGHDLTRIQGPSLQLQNQLVYGLVSPHTFHWTSDLLPALSSAGLSFRPTSFPTWLHQLRTLSSMQPHGSDDQAPLVVAAAANPNQNPALKLVDFFEETFQTAHGDAVGLGHEIKFETREAEKSAPALSLAPPIIESGLLGKMVQVWMERWREGNGV